MKHVAARLTACCLSVLVLAAAQAQAQSRSVPEEKPGLAARAQISPDAARKTALVRVPGGKIVKEELEEENGRLLYSFDLKVRRRSGVEEVQVDAKSGEVAAVQHEDAAKEADEAKREAGAPKP